MFFTQWIKIIMLFMQFPYAKIFLSASKSSFDMKINWFQFFICTHF